MYRKELTYQIEQLIFWNFGFEILTFFGLGFVQTERYGIIVHGIDSIA